MAPVSSRRTKLAGLRNLDIKLYPHAGLWLDKYMEKIPVSGEGLGHNEIGPGQQVIMEAARFTAPPLYKSYYDRWIATLTELGAICKVAKSLGRIAIGLGNESVQETAISLQRTYGVPYLPGSALKGLAARFAGDRLGPEWAYGSPAHVALFGNTDQAGYITFFDAYPQPTSDALLHPDIMAIHHPGYYRGEDVAPADWDDPTLVFFPTATGRYLVALAGPPAWVDAAFQILGQALQEMGIGAKTSSGYGRMRMEGISGLESAQDSLTAAAQTVIEPSETYEQAKNRLLKKEKAGEGRTRGTVLRVTQRVEKDSYAYIRPKDGGKEIHIYQSQLKPAGALREGQVVEFRVVIEPKGPEAIDVQVLLQPPA